MLKHKSLHKVNIFIFKLKNTFMDSPLADYKLKSDQPVAAFHPFRCSTLEIIYKDFGSRLFILLQGLRRKEREKRFFLIQKLTKFGEEKPQTSKVYRAAKNQSTELLREQCER